MTFLRNLFILAWYSWQAHSARSSAIQQRKFVAQMEEDLHAAERGIGYCDAEVSRMESKVRNAKIELRFAKPHMEGRA